MRWLKEGLQAYIADAATGATLAVDVLSTGEIRRDFTNALDYCGLSVNWHDVPLDRSLYHVTIQSSFDDGLIYEIGDITGGRRNHIEMLYNFPES